MLSYYNKALNPLRCTGNIFTSNQPSIKRLIEKRKGITKKLNLFLLTPYYVFVPCTVLLCFSDLFFFPVFCFFFILSVLTFFFTFPNVASKLFRSLIFSRLI